MRPLLLSAPLLPLVLAEGVWVRWRMPKLPPAEGPTHGRCQGAGPARQLLVIGESPVAGLGAPTVEQSLSGRLAEALARRDGRAVAWRALGENGITTRRVRDELLPRLDGVQADLVVLELGVNDVLERTRRRRWRAHLEGVLVEIERRYPAAPVVLLELPPMGRFPGLPQPLRAVLGWRSDELDEVLREVAAPRPRVWPVPTLASGDPDELFSPDGFHLAPTGYRAWADDLAGRIAELGLLDRRPPAGEASRG